MFPNTILHHSRKNTLQIPRNCTIEYENYKFGNTEERKLGKPLLLQIVNGYSLQFNKLQQKPLKIQSIPLEEIHLLQKHILATNQLSIEDNGNLETTYWIQWTILSIILVIIVSYVIYRI